MPADPGSTGEDDGFQHEGGAVTGGANMAGLSSYPFMTSTDPAEDKEEGQAGAAVGSLEANRPHPLYDSESWNADDEWDNVRADDNIQYLTGQLDDDKSLDTRTAKPATSSFIAADAEVLSLEERTWRDCLKEYMNKSWVETCIAGVIFFNFFLICAETDSRAHFPGRGEEGTPSHLVALGMDICYVIFCIELAMRALVDGLAFFKGRWGKLDAFIIGIGLIEYLIAWSGVETAGPLGIIRVIRLCRLLRLMRVMRLFSVLKELRRLLEMMGSCFKTLFWSFLLLCVVMTIWATIAVEVLNDLVQDVADKGAWVDCDRCRRSFSSVFMSNITFFQTVVAGDSWGYIAIPVIEEYPFSAIVFVGALLTLVFGVLNLIVAVIVDTFAEGREKDVVGRAADMEAEEIEEKRALAKIFKKIDEDESGALSYEELKSGAEKVAELRHWLRVMDIDARDLRQLFSIVDEDGSGEIDLEEFIEAMYRMKNAESRTATKFVKHIVTKLDKDQQSLKTELESLDANIEKVRESSEILMVQTEEELRARLDEQEIHLQRAIEVALRKASEVALEAGIQAANGATQKVLDSAKSSAQELVGGVHSRLRIRKSRQRPPQPGRQDDPITPPVTPKLVSRRNSLAWARSRLEARAGRDTAPGASSQVSQPRAGQMVLVQASGGDDPGGPAEEAPVAHAVDALWC